MARQPRYLWLADQLRGPILNGEMPPGTRLPSRTRLARSYRVSEQISRTALRLLVTEGLVESRPGSGYFVRAVPEVFRICRTDSSSGSGLGRLSREEIGTEQEQCSPPLSSRLRLREGDPVYRTTSRGLSSRTPITLHLSWEPAVLTAGTLRAPFDGAHDAGLLERLSAVGHPVDRVVEEVRVRALRDSEASLLGSAPGIPVLVVERTHYSGSRPVETSDLIGSVEQCRLLYKLTLARPRRPGDPRRY
ncbi:MULTISPECIES: GntR family transcriptional regulator [Nocardiopsis]|uniref:GntR family transcriptional regulator n=1 Tax=Nocardiopsis sinuspersici TaxID=501010 RepID=A0A1V3C9D7_9ACTN|nr:MULTISPECIES: GntR family transcriptional regulator [Nocardiopsis]NYH52812.1 DNA-binding GntR family transcriptional regulator [Nocardiopsis sinuspersici]OOC57377.1 GntR family transcriptional regulator [Nocardiopsis sinuspersici]